MASRGESTFAVNIVGNVKGLEKDLKAAGLWTDDLRGKIDQLNQHQINLKGERALAQLNSLGGTAETTGSKLRGIFSGEAQQAIQGYASRLGPAGEALGSIGSKGLLAAGAVAAIGLAVGKSITTFTALASEVAAFKRITGATAEDSSRLVAVLDDVGISADEGARAFQQLAKNVDSKKFAEIGVQIARTNTGATDLTGTFLNISRRLEGIKDPAERANLLIAAFGKQGEALGPIFDRGTEAIQRMMKANEGQVLSDADLRRAREFHDAMDQLGDVAKEVALGIAKIAIPVLTEAVKDFTWVVERAYAIVTKFDTFGESGAWKKAKEQAAALYEQQQKVADATKNIADAQKKANETAAAGYDAQLKAMQTEDKILAVKKAISEAEQRRVEVEKSGAEKVAAAKQKIADLEAKQVDAVKAVTAAQDKLNDASAKTASAQQRVNDAMFRYDQVLGRAAVDVKELADAQKDLADSQRTLTGLTEREAHAREALADAQKDLAKDAGRLPAQAQRDVAAAQRDQVRAQERLAELEQKRGDSTLTAKDRRDLELDIADAQDQVAESANRVADAQQALADVNETLRRKAEGVVDAQQALTDVQEEQAAAAQKVVDAEGNLNEVLNGSATGSDRAKKAAADLKDARDALKTATEQETTAQENLTKALDAQQKLPGQIKAAQQDLKDTESQLAKDRITAAEAVTAAYRRQKEELLAIQGAAAKAGEAIPASLDAVGVVPGTGVLAPGATTVLGPNGVRTAVTGTAKVGKFTPSQLANIATVVQVAKSHGYSDSQIAGILGNVSVETGGSFSTSAYNAKEDAVGLFQERTSYGSRADRQDPFKATQMILAEARRKGVTPGSTQDAGDFAALFDKLVERSDGKARAERTRRAEQLLNDPQIKTILAASGKQTAQKFAEGVEEAGAQLDDVAGQFRAQQLQMAKDAGYDLSNVMSRTITDTGSYVTDFFNQFKKTASTAAAEVAASQTAYVDATTTVLNNAKGKFVAAVGDLYSVFSGSNIGAAAAAYNKSTPAYSIGGTNLDGSGITVHAFAQNPITGGTLFDKTGRPVYIDDTAGIAAALKGDNPNLDPFTSNIPAFANGGIVNGPTVGLVGEAGPEAIIPLRNGGGLGGPTINVTVQGSVITERDLVEQIRKQLIVAQQRGLTLVP